jgi:IS6 family transposase
MKANAFGRFWTAGQTLAGYEAMAMAMAMVRMGRVGRIGGCATRAQATFIAALFDIAASFDRCRSQS